MKKVLLLMIALCFASCTAATTDVSKSSDASKTARGESSSGRTASVDIKVTKNGKPLATFQTANNANVSGIVTDDDLSIEISDADRKTHLSISVSGTKAGTYRLADTYQTGKAMLLLTGGDDAMMLRPDTGELTLDEVNDNHFSGSFTGKVTDATGKKYVYEGKFSKVRAPQRG